MMTTLNFRTRADLVTAKPGLFSKSQLIGNINAPKMVFWITSQILKLACKPVSFMASRNEQCTGEKVISSVRARISDLPFRSTELT